MRHGVTRFCGDRRLRSLLVPAWVEAHGLALDAGLWAMSSPDGFEGVHSLLRCALQLGVRAAVGTLMFFDRASAALARLLSYPELP